MVAAMSEVGIGASEQEGIFDLVAGVIWLGNIKFIASAGGSKVDPSTGEISTLIYLSVHAYSYHLTFIYII